MLNSLRISARLQHGGKYAALTGLTAALLSMQPSGIVHGQTQSTGIVRGQARTLVAVLAHADDEGPVGPVLARYAREGVQVYLLVASDGAQGTEASAATHADSTIRGERLAQMRADEARCAAEALGAQPPILLGFPDGKLGDYPADRALMYRLTARIAAELERLHPDAVITWGPDGGTGHPDHRLVSDIVVQLFRAGAPGVPERIYFMNLPAEAMRTMNPQRGAPLLLIPQDKYFTVKISFEPADVEHAHRAMACHRSQFTPETLQRVFPAQERMWNGSISLIPAFSSARATDLFR